MPSGAFITGFAVPIDYHTESANTAITENVVPPNNISRLALTNYEYLPGANAHIMSIMYPGNFAGARTTAKAAAAAGIAIIECANAPKDGLNTTIAASDIVAYETDVGWEWNVVASVSGNNVTHSANLTGNVAIGAKYRVFGVVGDNVSFQFTFAASTTAVQDDKWIVVHPEVGVPFYVSISNNIAAGALKRMQFVGINK
jgi:hypothetical protein